MPTYEYECTHCGRNFEIFQKISDPPLGKCPKCNAQIRRLISSGSGIIFKGSGFYATDYRKKPKTDTSKPAPSSCPNLKEGCDACQGHK
ncbi:MAG: FmdB family zinc ribbon protein [Candidatus Omnitrophota bacterium]